MRTRYDAPDTAERAWHWADEAACRDYEPVDTFFPDSFTGPDLFTVAAAKSICVPCPVRGDCLAHALDRNEPAGIWGGLTTDERQELRATGGREREGPRAVA